MNPIEEKLENCFKQIKERISFEPKVALILGSGLGALADEIRVVDSISYNEIEGFPVSTVAGHKGRFVFGYIEETPVVIMQGRVHYYEGYPMSDVVLPTRLMGLLGAKILFLTNAAGGINKGFTPGTLMMLTDQISSFVPSPLIGENIEKLGTRFPDMSTIYDLELRKVLREQAKELSIDLREGTYIQFTGPAYETPAEIKMASLLGADACGMSTACEAVAANHMGLRVCGISCITNMASGLQTKPLSHVEVQETADRVANDFKKLVWNSIAQMKDI